MKKTVFLFATALSALIAFGQSADQKVQTITYGNKVAPAVFQTQEIIKPETATKKTFTKSSEDSTILHLTFSKPERDLLTFGQYAKFNTIGFNLVEYPYGNWFWTANATETEYNKAAVWNNISNIWQNLGRPNAKVLGMDSPTNSDGFLLIDPISNVQENRIGDYHAWVQFPGFNTKNVDVVAVEFFTASVKGNETKFLEYSVDSGKSFSQITIDSLRPWVQLGEPTWVMNKVVLPKVCSNQDSVLLRFVYKNATISSTTGGEFAGYPIFIDDLTVKSGRVNDLTIDASFYKDFYPFIPQGILTPPITWQAFLSSTGSVDAFDVVGNVTIKNVSTGANTLELTTDTLKNIVFKKDTIAWLGSASGKTDMIPTAVKANYITSQAINFNTTGELPVGNPFTVSVNYNQTDSVPNQSEWKLKNYGTWARENGNTKYSDIWQASITYDANNNPGLSLDPNLCMEKDYGVMLRFMLEDFSIAEPHYFNGVQVVLNNLYTKPGAVAIPVVYSVSVDETSGNATWNLLDPGTTTVTVSSEDISSFENNPQYFYPEAATTKFNMYFRKSIPINKKTIYYLGYKLPSKQDFIVQKNSKMILTGENDYYSPIDIAGFDGIFILTSQGPSRFAASSAFPMVRALVSRTYLDRTGIATPEEINFELSCFPNPAANQISVTYTLKEAAQTTIEIRDITGRLVKSVKSNAQAQDLKVEEININELKNGTYIFTLNVNGLKQSKKFVVNK